MIAPASCETIFGPSGAVQRTFVGPQEVVRRRREAVEERAQPPVRRRTVAAEDRHARPVVDHAGEQEDVAERGDREAPVGGEIDRAEAEDRQGRGEDDQQPAARPLKAAVRRLGL